MKRRIVYALTLAGCMNLGSANAVTFDLGLQDLQKGWAVAKYRTPENEQEAAFEQLTKQAEELVEANPGKAEALIWEAIIVSSDAGVTGGLGALGKVKKARDLLLKAEAIDAKALDGSVYTSLGSLYYQVPGWPLGFGDDDKAEEYLKKALSQNPDGIDPNYFYADFLIEDHRFDEAAVYIDKALAAPDRPGREVADEGRREEVRQLRAKLQTQHGWN